MLESRVERAPPGALSATERAGFEPATQLSPRTRFPVALLRPLGHLSESDNLSVRLAGASPAEPGRRRVPLACARGLDRSLQVLPTGAEARFAGQHGRLAVVCANGGQSAEVPGTWSASIEWLVGRLAPLFPDLLFAELRYRIKSWKRLDLCVEDALAAIEASGAERALLMGFSMGGAVAGVPRRIRRWRACSAWRPGFPISSTSRRSAAAASTSCTARSTAGCPGIPGVSPSSSDEATNGRAGSASTARTRSFPAPCTASPCAARGVPS